MIITSVSYKYGQGYWEDRIVENRLFRIDVEFEIGDLKGTVRILSDKFLSEEELKEEIKDELKRGYEKC